MPMMIRSYAQLAIVSAVLATCTDKGSKSLTKEGADSLEKALSHIVDTSGSFTKMAHRYGPPTGKIRVANLLEIDGKPSGPLDFYDARNPDSSDVPLIKHLAYGQISDYVSPRAEGPYDGAKSFLYVFPADQKTATRPFGGILGQTGYAATDQISVALGPSKGVGGHASITIIDLPEAGKRVNVEQADTATKIQAGQALFVVREVNMNVDSMPELYFMVDGKCPHAPNDTRSMGDTAKYRTEPSNVSTTLFFPIAAGTHTLGIVTSPRGRGLQNCNGLSPASTTTVNVEAGRRYTVWVFGEPGDGFKAVAAPIANP
ncbi:MAG TPA: hypothetical protein VK511_02915 [Gemmatimonadaceae bacterium]|nr:hypothetical protein [Gemmatimonadaceae bacterium]